MSQDIRDYVGRRVDEVTNEADCMSLTSTVQANGRGIQITLDSYDGTVYVRLTEPQVKDLVTVLEMRLDPDLPYEATGIEADRVTIDQEGNVV